MRKVILIGLILAMAIPAIAKDITIKNVPDGITDAQVQEWNAILIERFYNAKINQIPEVVQATEVAKTGIDSFRKANTLAPKFCPIEKEIVKEEPVVEPEPPITPIEPVVEEPIIEEPVKEPVIGGVNWTDIEPLK